MALTPGRWLAVFAVGACAIVAAVIGVRAATRDRFLDFYFDDFAWRSSSNAEGLSSAAAMLERRDSLAAAWRKSAAPSAFEVVVGPGVPAVYRHALDSAARAFWSEQVRGAPRGRTVLIIASDSATHYRGIRVDHSSPYLLAPAQTDGRTCAVLLPMEIGLVSKASTPYARARTLRGVLQQNAGPCVWFAKYGVPGRALGAWLLEQNYRPALSILERDPDYTRSFARGVRSHTAAATVAPGWYSAGLGLPAAGCLAGRSSQCDAMWTDPVRQMRRNARLPRGFVPVGSWWGDIGPTGILSTHFVARLEAALGPEKFARLWASDAPIDRAFADLAGATLAGETRRLLLADYGELLATPWPTALEWALDLGLIVLGLGALMLLARRRAASA